MDPVQTLKNMQPKNKFFVGIDSDGCVFDSMEIKHKECFTPAYINHFGLQAVSKYARECWDFVNLYSKTRGVNRFPALIRALDLLAERPEVKARGITPPKLEGLRAWMKRETKLGNATLKAEAKKTNDPDLLRTLAWSEDVNAAVEKIVRDVPPFPLVKECFDKLQKNADMIVCSQTPTEALEREWKEHHVDHYVRIICGQEMGTKTEHLNFAAGGKYEPTSILMIGDAPGDFKAADGNKALFFPINPGDEEASWKELYEVGIERFFNGTFAGSYAEGLIKKFETFLPESPSWKK